MHECVTFAITHRNRTKRAFVPEPLAFHGLFTLKGLHHNLGCRPKWVVPRVEIKAVFLFFFIKKQDFVLFLRKTEKPHSELFLLHHAKSPFSELHRNNLLYLLCHSKLRVKKCTPSLFSQSVVGQFTLSGKAWQARTQQTEKTHSHTNTTVSCQVNLCAGPASSASIECFSQHMIWYGPKSGKARMQSGQKNWLKYTDCAELKKTTITIY